MTTAAIVVDARRCTFSVGDRTASMPIGSADLTESQLHGDPPKPAELTNAIGAVVDHLDDVLRALPEIVEAADVEVRGDDVSAIASVEAGRLVSGPFELSRAAAEDVFRTLATEQRSTRARNPGLIVERLDTVVGGCCVVVALMRHLQLDAITVVEQIDVGTPLDAGGPR